jgi:DNA-binding MarR family transcriptional regulator
MKGESHTTITAEQRKAFADLLKATGGARQRALSALDRAMTKVLAVESAEEAAKIVESLL